MEKLPADRFSSAAEFIIAGAPSASRTLAVTLDPFDALQSDRRRPSQP